MPVVLYEKRDDKIAVITLNRPEAMNALNREVGWALAEAWTNVRDDPDVWVAVITGTGGKAFSAGADLKEMSQRNETLAAGAGPTRWAPSLDRDLTIWKPIIAAINGYCLAGGLELALSCDIRIASEESRFSLAEVKRAIIPGGGGTQRLPRAVPFGIALEMLYTGDMIDAQTAYGYGLINRVVPAAEIMPAAIALAQRINENGPLAVRAVKEAAYRGRDVSLEQGLAIESQLSQIVRFSEDSKEGPKAFAEKRKAVFKGR